MDLQALMGAPEVAQKKYLALRESGTFKEVEAANGEVKVAREALTAAIVEGCKPCPSCGGIPHGMVQVWVVEKEKCVGFEIGCPRCPDHCAVGWRPEVLEDRLAAARRNWNGGPSTWYAAVGSNIRAALSSSGEVVLRYVGQDGQGIGGEFPEVSCKVGDEVTPAMLKARDARVAAFRDTYQATSEPGLTVH